MCIYIYGYMVLYDYIVFYIYSNYICSPAKDLLTLVMKGAQEGLRLATVLRIFFLALVEWDTGCVLYFCALKLWGNYTDLFCR
jgi:hypothetical protein